MKDCMRNQFKGYSRYSDKEYQEIWEQAIIVVDANILLNFYRYSNETRSELYEVLKTLKKRLWIPYQVAYEYFKNKEKVMVEANNDFDKLLKDAESCFSNIINKVKEKPSKRLKCKDNLLKSLENSQKEIEKIIIADKDNSKKQASEEKVEELIFELFDNSIGLPIVSEEYEKVKEEGIRRFKEKIPPGYKDSEKDENGDYYIFYSLIKYAKENSKHIIFITDDVKEDWFTKRFGEIKSGDYRILNEFYKETGKLLLIYTSDGFINSYQKNIKNPRIVDDNVIDELIANRKENREYLGTSTISFYRQKIKNILRRLYDYKIYSNSRIFKELDSLKERLVSINLFDNYTANLIRMLHIAFEKKENGDIKILLKRIEEYIDRRISDYEELPNNYKLGYMDDFYEVLNYNLKLDNEKNYIIDRVSSALNKLEKAESLCSIDRMKFIKRIDMLLKEVNNIEYLKKKDVVKLNEEIDELYRDIDMVSDESTV